jgi:hypothetical protein
LEDNGFYPNSLKVIAVKTISVVDSNCGRWAETLKQRNNGENQIYSIAVDNVVTGFGDAEI